MREKVSRFPHDQKLRYLIFHISAETFHHCMWKLAALQESLLKICELSLVLTENHILQHCPNKTSQSHVLSSDEETHRKWGWDTGCWRGGWEACCLCQLILSSIHLNHVKLSVHFKKYVLVFDPLGQPQYKLRPLFKKCGSSLHKRFTMTTFYKDNVSQSSSQVWKGEIKVIITGSMQP